MVEQNQAAFQNREYNATNKNENEETIQQYQLNIFQTVT